MDSPNLELVRAPIVDGHLPTLKVYTIACSTVLVLFVAAGLTLVRLQRLPVEEIKIDSSFVQRLHENGDDVVIVRSIIDLVRALGLRSVAEGVEDEQTATVLREMGCDAAQGWYFGKPMPESATTTWLLGRTEAVAHGEAAG